MKIKEQIEKKIARSKERVKQRNLWKESRRALQGAKMIISEEEVEARKKAGKKSIVPKKWKEKRRKALLEAEKLSRAKPKDFYSEELRARRKARRERLKKIKQAIQDNYSPQAIYYMKNLDCSIRKIEAKARFEMRVIHLKEKEARRIAKKQSKEDKAKYKASLIKFKETYKCTGKNKHVDVLNCHRRKKIRGYTRKQLKLSKQLTEKALLAT